MKITIIIFCIILILSTTACAPSPQNDIVTNKNDTYLDGILYNSNNPEISVDNTETFSNNTTHKSTSFSSNNGIINFNIESDISCPSATAIPVLQVTPHYFTTDEVKQIALAVFGNSPMYEYSEIFTKSELEIMILQAKQYISDYDYLLNLYHGDENSVKRIIETYNDSISAMEADYMTAPDTPKSVITDFEYHPDSYYTSENSSIYFSKPADGIMSIQVTSTLNDIPYLLYAAKKDAPNHKVSNLYIYPYDKVTMYHESWYFQKTPFTRLEQEQAVSLVETFLTESNLKSWKIDSFELISGVYNNEETFSMHFKCVPLYNGIELISENVTTFSPESPKYSATYIDTNLEIWVSNGQIMTVWYEAPLDTVKIINEDVQLLSADDLFNRICEQLPLMWTVNKIADLYFGGKPELIDSATLNVTEVKFAYTRTQIKDNPDDFYLMPSWIVYGNYNDEFTMPLLILNAIDGSVIDASQGY